MKYLIIAVLSSFIAFAQADDQSKHKAIDKLMQITNVESTIDGLYEQMEAMMQSMGDQMGVGPAEQPILDEYHSSMRMIMQTEMSWEQMKQPMTALYAKHFSEEEINDMIAFYQSETGRKTIEKMPVVMQESMAISQQLVQNALPKIQQVTEQMQNDLAKVRGEKQ